MPHFPKHHTHAHRVMDYNGVKMYSFPVYAHLNDSRLMDTIAVRRFDVIAHTVADAANRVRDEFSNRAETEVYAYGPKGGEAYRYVGWYSAIGNAMFRPRGAREPELGFAASN